VTEVEERYRAIEGRSGMQCSVHSGVSSLIRLAERSGAGYPTNRLTAGF
jgi:hypothetical protein